MLYPGRIIKVGEQDASIVRALKVQLNEALVAESNPNLRLDPNDPHFGPRVEQAVRLFQARHVDADGRPLRQDGEVGSLTWSALFGNQTVAVRADTSDTLLARVVQVAAGEEARHVREEPTNSNRGEEVDAYLDRAGAQRGSAWCCAFVYYCFDEAARALGRKNPMVKTALCLDHWNRAPAAGARRILTSEALADHNTVRPGMTFVIDHGGGHGHTGLVASLAGSSMTTIEGNTDGSGTREGDGVYRLTRNLSEINKGFIDYSRV